MPKHNEPHVLLVSRPNAEGYPPVIHQAGILTEQGYEVSVADQCGEASILRLPAGGILKRFRLGGLEGGKSKLKRIWGVFCLCRDARRLIRRLLPDIVIAYDPEACFAVGRSVKAYGGKLSWHFHERPEQRTGGFSIGRFAIPFILNNATLPDLIIFPDAQRAVAYADAAGIDHHRILIAMNCPRLIQEVPSRSMQKLLGERLAVKARTLVYCGSVGPHHGLEIAIRSIPHWPSDVSFVIWGSASQEYNARLVALAREVGVPGRVILAGFYSPGYEVYAAAHVGWTVLEPNYKYSAGASNKRFECMAVGVPQITDNSPDTEELMAKAACGICISPGSAESVARAVNLLFNDEDLCRRLGSRGREAHLNELNYENQFKCVLEGFSRLLRTN